MRMPQNAKLLQRTRLFGKLSDQVGWNACSMCFLLSKMMGPFLAVRFIMIAGFWGYEGEHPSDMRKRGLLAQSSWMSRRPVQSSFAINVWRVFREVDSEQVLGPVLNDHVPRELYTITILYNHIQ